MAVCEKMCIFAGENKSVMCTYNITLNDTLVEKARPAFADDKALQNWLQEQMSIALELFLSSGVEKKSAQQVMVEESLTTAFNELHSGQAKKNARALFAQ